MEKFTIKPRFQAMLRINMTKSMASLPVHDKCLEQLDMEFPNKSLVKELSGGRLNKVYRIVENENDMVIKFSFGTYRVAELFREGKILNYLKSIGLSKWIPNYHNYIQKDEFAYLIEDFIGGQSIRELIDTGICSHKAEYIWWHLGKVLSEIHQVLRATDLSNHWLNGQLKLAQMNLSNELVDLDDFLEENPEEILEWLFKHKPERTQVSLLHGDFRTKNIIYDNEKKFKVIDWGFVDIGDPLYDLAIIDYYFENDLDRENFYKGYSKSQYDADLIDYYEKLSRFINI